MGDYIIKCTENLIGKKFGKLVVIDKGEDYVYKNGVHVNTWICRCDCGNIISKLERVLKRYKKLSCGCSNTELYQSYEDLYDVWIAIKQRCTNPNDKSYCHYGGSGIKICDEWLNNYSIFKKWAYENGYDVNGNTFKNCTIDRINVYGDYCPENCRIVNRTIQNDNTTRTIYVEKDGIIHSIKEWSDITGIPRHTIWCRINQRGWDSLKAITTPVNKQFRNKNAKERE